MIGFVYDLSDMEVRLKCWRMGYIFGGKHPLLMKRIQVSNPRPMGPFVLEYRLPYEILVIIAYAYIVIY